MVNELIIKLKIHNRIFGREEYKLSGRCLEVNFLLWHNLVSSMDEKHNVVLLFYYGRVLPTCILASPKMIQLSDGCNVGAISIVFVCTGNICRSPMAEGIFRSRWDVTRNGPIVVSSLGTHGLASQPASPLAVQVCADAGIDISRHISRPVNFRELDIADMIFCMEPMHKDFIDLYVPGVSDKTALLAAWPEKGGRNSVVDDPYGAGIRTYNRAFDEITKHIERVMPNIIDIYWSKLRTNQ